MPKPLQFFLNGVDITDKVYEAVIEKQEKRAADKCDLTLARTVSVSINDDFKVMETTGNRYIFGGRVVEINKEYGLTKCVVLSYGKVFDEIRIFPARVYTNTSPEGIVNDLRANYFNDFTLSSASSGVTIQRYEAVGTISENLKILADIAGFDYWTELSPTGAKILNFRPANTNLGKTLYFSRVGSNPANAYRISYELDDSQLFTAVEVYGRSRSEKVFYRWDTLYSWGIFRFPRTIYSIGLRVNDVDYVEGIDFRYYADDKILFIYTSYPVSRTNPARIEIRGEVDATPLVYKEDPAKVAFYGRRTAAIILEKESSGADLDVFATKFLQRYSSPRLTIKAKIPKLDFGIKDGGFVTVYDPLLGINGQNFVVRTVRWRYPEGTTEVLLGQFEPELYDFQRGITFRVDSSSRSYIQSRDFGVVEKKFYLSGSESTATLEDSSNSVVSGSGVGPPTSLDEWIRLRLRLVGATTLEYNDRYTALIFVPYANVGPVKAYYISPISIGPLDADSSNRITIYAQFYRREDYYSTSEYIIAPSTTSTSYFFTKTINGVSRLLESTLGGVLYISKESFSTVVHWSREYPSHLFGFGFKLA